MTNTLTCEKEKESAYREMLESLGGAGERVLAKKGAADTGSVSGEILRSGRVNEWDPSVKSRALFRREVSKRKAEDRHFYESAAIVNIETDKLRPNRSQPRVNFESNATIRLADSIRRYGILQPLSVRVICRERKTDKDYLLSGGEEDLSLRENGVFGGKESENAPCFEIIAGERRFRAAKMLGMRSVPCIIIGADDRRSAELALIENLLREDLNIFETARAIKKLIENFKLTQEDVAKRLSMSQSAIANKLRLLRYTPEEEALILENHLTERHARAILKIGSSDERLSVIRTVIKMHMNVSATENYIEKLFAAAEETVFESVQSKKIPIIKDIRLFYNSLERALEIVRSAGVDASSVRKEEDDGVIIEIKIPYPKTAG
ncbi:MAG: ParB/RepB/Spo0J family partition protein [Clostridia bacterium]|nr:ParB/RepB/Spo0J family partition protein [Clostridia bacterium]